MVPCYRKVEGQKKETEKKQKDITIITAKQKEEGNSHLKLQKGKVVGC